jgi:hypothetical protein
MGIKALDERHKRFAEMMLAGKPRTMRERAEELGVDRATLYLWAKDELWLGYFDKLADDVHAARVQRLTPLVLNACDALGAALDNALADLTSGDPLRLAASPGLSTLSTVTKTLVELERVDAGKPGTISRSEHRDDKPLDKASEKLLAKLDELFKEDGEDTVSEERGESVPAVVN